ncbi:MAG: ABC transporter permease [Spirochaetaceae bacterium]|jgi:lipoprotein-releasing system permease protein|nr:ABC transporter permease [Spirochaetaceae bacterium]
MKINTWIAFVAARTFSGKRSKSSASSILSIFEIGAGVLALTVIIAVMNGFQLGFIENILEISSYYVRVENVPVKNIASLVPEIKKVNEVTAVVPFVETQGIMSGAIEDGHCAALLRGFPPGVEWEDAGMMNHLEFVQGGFYIQQEDSILLGAELAARLNVEAGDSVTFISISNLIPQAGEDEADTGGEFIVRGIFRTEYYEYDASWGFISMERAALIEGNTETCTIGIKLKNRYHDIIAADAIKKITAGTPGAEVRLWRDFNKSFFNALRTEKLLMFVLVGLIFIVVALNIYQAQRRTVLERSEEIGLLRAVGAPDFSVRWVFALKGLIIGFSGATGGMILAILISTNIQAFFSFIEALVNTVTHAVYIVSTGFLPEGDFAVFSRRIFYISEYTARLLLHEVLFIYFFAVISAFAATWRASGKISKIKPSEVLRNE